MTEFRRGIKSFVLRQGRLTAGQERALEVLWPQFGLSIDDGVINPEAVFSRAAPLCLEIGFGMGDSLVEQARLNQNTNYIGIEVHRPGVGHLLMQVEQHNLANVRVYAEDSVDVLSQVIPEESLDAVQIFFPDPWHKKRHHKRRIITSDFIKLLASRMSQGGVVHVATDWEPYAEDIEALFQAAPQFSQIEAPQRPETKFERRGQKLGHRIRDLAFSLDQ